MTSHPLAPILSAIGRLAHVFFTALGAALSAISGMGGNRPLTPPDQPPVQRREGYRP